MAFALCFGQLTRAWNHIRQRPPRCDRTGVGCHCSLRPPPPSVGASSAIVEAASSSEISGEELSAGLKAMKCGKAAGPGLPPELIKFCGCPGHSFLCGLFSKCAQFGVSPSQFKIGIIIPLHKADDRMNLGNYLNVIRKLYTWILNKRMMSILKCSLPDSQAGFRPFRGFDDQLFALMAQVDDSVEAKKKCLVTFYDVAKAFDTVWHKALHLKLFRLGVPWTIINAVRDLLDNNTQQIRCEGRPLGLLPQLDGSSSG